MKNLLLLLLLFSTFAVAQQKSVDSLVSKLKEQNNNSSKADLLFKLGTAYANSGKYNDAIKTYKQLIQLSKQQKIITSLAYNEIGNAYSDLGDNKAAFNAYQVALKNCNPDSLSLQAKINKNIGAVFLSWKNLPVALNYYDEAQQLAIQAKDKITEADCLNNKGTVYEQQNDFKKAFEVYKHALSIYKEEKLDQRIALTYNNLAILSKVNHRLEQAAEYYRKSIVYASKADNAWLTAAISNNLGNLLSEMGNTAESHRYLQKSLVISKKIDAKELVYESLENLAENANRMGNYFLAYNFHKQSSLAKNQFINLENTKEVSRLQTEFETEKKERALAESRAAFLQSEIQISKKNDLLIYSLAGLLVVICGSVIIYLTLQNRQKRLKSEADLNLKLANAKALNQLQEEKLRISRELHDNIGSQLTFINSSINGLNRRSEPDFELLSETQKLTQHTIAELRRTVWFINKQEVHLEEFVIKLRDYIKPLCMSNPDAEIIINSSGNCVLKPVAATNLFRIIQESVNNSIKYAQATVLQISLKCETDSLLVSIEDNGLGFNTSSVDEGNGLKNIKNRAQLLHGECYICSVVGKGTTVTIKFPV